MFLSNLSIRNQILLGYAPVLIVLLFLAFSSLENYKKSHAELIALRQLHAENMLYHDLEKDMIELQRNVLVYSYVGYNGILKKIEFVQSELESNLNILERSAGVNAEIQDRYDRIFFHYQNYKEGFARAAKEKRHIQKIDTLDRFPLVSKLKEQLESIRQLSIESDNATIAYKISIVEKKLQHADDNVSLFAKAPDSNLFNEARSLLLEIRDEITDLNLDLVNANLAADDVHDTLNEYEDAIVEIIKLNRTYLYLVNVVLPGKAVEIDKLLDELNGLMDDYSEDLSIQIHNNISDSQTQLFIFSVLAGVFGVISSLVVAMGIANPVRAMAETLSVLSHGNVNVDIPGRERKDEVGQMADAAHEFKLMAMNLDNQTVELEEFAYRTSHDLRSPLISAIALLGRTKKLIGEGENEKSIECLSHVDSSLKKLERLVSDLLQLAKTTHMEEEDSVIDVDEIVDSSLSKFSNLDNYDRLDICITNDLRSEVYLKKSRFELIVENLISNSIKYQDLDEENSYIDIRCFEKNGAFIFSVSDNGLGIPNEQEGRLFQMFRRFHTNNSFGSGLGLYMMKKSAIILGGDITYENPGKGAAFTLTVPLRKE